MLTRTTAPPHIVMRAVALASVAVLLSLQVPGSAFAQNSRPEPISSPKVHDEALFSVDDAAPEEGGRSLVLDGVSDLISLEQAEMELRGARKVPRRPAHQDRNRFWRWPAQDALALLKGVGSETTLMAAGSGAVLLLAARHDGDITADLVDLKHEPDELLVKIIEEFGNVRSVRPLAGFVFLGTLMTDDQRLQDAAFTSFEAVVMANLVTSGLKTAFGRARPYQDQGAFNFKPLSGNTSFPSGHSTTAFAFVTPWLIYYPNAFTPGLLVLGAGTAFTRLLTDNHWFTDIVAGGAIGFATAYFLSRRHQNERQRIYIEPSLSTEHVGVTVAVKMN